MSAPARSRRRIWRGLVPVICLLAGFGFAVSAHVSHGTDLRPPGTANLADLVRSAEAQVKVADGQYAALQSQVSALTAAAGRADSSVAAAQRARDALAGAGGLTAEHGPGIVVVLNDASTDAANAGVDPNQLVVHQGDLQAVVNALWAGGAEAMTIAGQRVVATSAVRCVGNTLLLNGEVYSPPFRVAAIGPYRTMEKTLAASPGVKEFVQAAGYYGLGYTVEGVGDVDLPPYVGSIGLTYARAGTR
ncbi:DUF881 domain-containing protein [Jatrophihabitans sp.]|uniref:DUF881 domain-containing protein n=1 Tax=Jatrophihabitans sp. TaxID=1932789 RepID=UPI0030C6DF96|nr:hypothetical protein [Jatrophihabitans sp.]